MSENLLQLVEELEDRAEWLDGQSSCRSADVCRRAASVIRAAVQTLEDACLFYRRSAGDDPVSHELMRRCQQAIEELKGAGNAKTD